jgi:CheY-like chemotaxis protein
VSVIFVPEEVATVLLVDDDENDCLFFQRALKRNDFPFYLHWARNGKEAIDYISGAEPYGDRIKFPFPKFIITDTKMPMVSGREFLIWLKGHPEFSVVPTIVLAGASSQGDVDYAYEHLGIHSYIEKPQDNESLRELVKRIFDYWTACRLPRCKV